MDVRFEVTVFASQLAAASPSGVESAQVCIVGNADELGAWDTRRAVPLTLVEEMSATEKRFAATVPFPPEREFFPLQYKYFIRDALVNEAVSWEAIPGDRSLTLTRASNVARGRSAKQSSTYASARMPRPGYRRASLGNDGSRNGFDESRCPRTTREPYPWWTVDLGEQVELQRLNLWKALTYHEQPKRACAQPAASEIKAAQMSSALPPAPLWIFVSSEFLSDRSGADLIKLAHAPGYLPESVTKIVKVDYTEGSRVESVDLDGVKGRFVCLQHESESSVLSFAEIEIFAKHAKEQTKDKLEPLMLADGFYGVDASCNSDLREYIDTEWVDPRGERSLVRVWVGSFRKDIPAIQWFDGSAGNRPIHVEMTHVYGTGKEGKDEVTPQIVPVDSRGASLLDKDGGEFQKELTAYLHHPHRDLKRYLNSTEVRSVDEWLQRFESTHMLTEVQLQLLKSHVTTRTFHDGETLLEYGEQVRTAFFIEEGEVNIVGPPTASNARENLGKITGPTAVNDLALFSSWPERCAAFKAKGKVVAQVVTYAALKQAIGENKLRILRHQLIRERHALDSSASGEVNELLVVDAVHAQVFRTKVPTSALAPASSMMSLHKLTLEFYEASNAGCTDITSTNEKGRLLGTTPLLLSQLNEHGEGYLTLPILSKNVSDIPVVGQVSVHYLVVKPFAHEENNLANVWRSYWRERVPLGGGHRGMGRHFNQVGDFRKALTRENTLASFLLAGKSGADFVEFDVQLTKDHIPVLYHDFIFRVGLEDTRAWTRGTKGEQQDVAIHRLTYRELQRANTTPVPRKEMPRLKWLIKKHWNVILKKSQKSYEALNLHDEISPNHEHLVDFYPRLEDLLKHVPPQIGLNIEIKYPDPFKRSTYRFSPSFAMNYYVDRILECVFTHANPAHRIFFSCFDPDLVVALRAKQAKYPVFFLTYGRVQPPALDARLTLQFAVNFVKMEKLMGIVSNSDEFIAQPACAEVVKRDGIVLMTWGDQNTSHECVQLQKCHAIDGVISDNIGDLTRADKRCIANPKKN